MRGVSVESRTEVLARVDAAVDGGADAAVLGDELFAVTGLLDGSPALRRAVTDPSAAAEARAGLLRSLLEGKLSDATIEIVTAAAALRWSASRDLGDAVEEAGVMAQVEAAERSGQADELEDELFRFARIVAGDSRLREALTDRTVPVGRRQQFARELLHGKAGAPTIALAAQAVAGRHRSFDVAMQRFAKLAADRRQRFVATVHTATELSEEEKGRLSAALERQYGRPVHLNVVVDPALLGGLRVELGEEVIDGTVASKLDDARRRLAG